MNEYITNTTYDAVADRMKRASRILLLTHGKPDGDAIGSILALHRGLRSVGKPSEIFVKGPVSAGLRAFIADGESVHLLEQRTPDDAYDLVVIADTGAKSQLDPIGDWVAARAERTIVLDHHVNGNADLASMRIVDAGLAAAAHLVANLLDRMGVRFAGGPFSIAEALLLGLATDTGWFRFNSATPESFRLAARLLEAGADKSRIYALTEENDSSEQLALKARAIESIEYVAGGAAAVMTLSPGDFKAVRAQPDETGGIVNEPLSIASVRVSALVTSIDGKMTKISLRSKPAVKMDGVTLPGVDVNAIAHQFGGGGHVHAAGARVERPLEEVRRDLIAALEPGRSERDDQSRDRALSCR